MLRYTVTLAERAGLGVCIDLFCCWSEAGLRATIERAIPRCGIVQVSDYVYGDRAMPCRAVPGDGAIPIRTMHHWMLRDGYEGAFDPALLGPRPTPDASRSPFRRPPALRRIMLPLSGAS